MCFQGADNLQILGSASTCAELKIKIYEMALQLMKSPVLSTLEFCLHMTPAYYAAATSNSHSCNLLAYFVMMLLCQGKVTKLSCLHVYQSYTGSLALECFGESS